MDDRARTEGRALHIRELRASDEAEWCRLWTGYLAFYETRVPEEVYRTTFSRLLSDDPWMPSAFVATFGSPGETGDGAPLVGLVHYLYHAHCWRLDRICYLQDLFVDPGIRGGGVGRALMERVYAQADIDSAAGVYWMTQTFNTTARALYDRIGTATPFMKYQR
ncbi:MAG: GNAT family N-acetyltransferase [Alphaproteobacteria bacterium]|nr:GNAT family N-acetyltransferase [Alphaproteobacteria bacterium]